MPTINFILTNGERVSVDTTNGVSVMEEAVRTNIEGIIGECGGNQVCSTCHVYVYPAWAGKAPPMEEHENDLLDGAAAERRATSRLSCQIVMSDELDGLTIEIPETQY